MKIISLNANNYRTLQDVSITFSKYYCTISGKNNAGKSCVIRLLIALFQKYIQYQSIESTFDYKEDKTQWEKQNLPINIEYKLELSRNDDQALIEYIEKLIKENVNSKTIVLTINYSIIEGDKITITSTINGKIIDEETSKDIDNKVKESNILFLYNSTIPHDEYYYYTRGRSRQFYEFIMSEEEKKKIDETANLLEKRYRKLAKVHKEGINKILGNLKDKYDVEFSQPEKYFSRRMPLGINLKDRYVEVPLNNWGSGTQNRTRILMAILQASRIQKTEVTKGKITPIVVIEEPESFLHPSAQSEFGRILDSLSKELDIQIIVTTHSPYLLNRDDPVSNILLSRECKRGNVNKTFIVKTVGNGWMAPFAEHLGISQEEFLNWREVFTTYKSKVLLVEGPLDKEYFEYFKSSLFTFEKLNNDIEIVPYGGKGALKNTLILKFVLDKFDRVIITFDLDAEKEVRSYLERLGLNEKKDYLSIGVNQSGKERIEGLLPIALLSKVNAKETDLVMKLQSQITDERNNAKDQLKRKYLEELKIYKFQNREEAETIIKLIKKINYRFE